MKAIWKGLTLLVVLVALGASVGAVLLWNQVVRLQNDLSSLRRELQNYRQKEAAARRIDTSSKRDEWLLNNGAKEALGGLKPPPKYARGLLKSLWMRSYSPRKGQIYDVAAIEWRMSGRSRGQGESELVEVLWVASVVNSSKNTGYDMTLELEFLDEKGFRLAETTGKGYIFPVESDADLARVTKLRGSFWVPLRLAKEINSVSGVWRAIPDF